MSGVLLFAHPHKGSSEPAQSWERTESRVEGARGKERKVRFIYLFIYLFFCEFRYLTILEGGGLVRAGESQHRVGEIQQPWRGSYLHLALSGTSPFPGFPWNVFAVRSSLPPRLFRTYVLPRLRVSVAVGSQLCGHGSPIHVLPHPTGQPPTTVLLLTVGPLWGCWWSLSSPGQADCFQQKYEMAERLFLNLSRKLTSHHIGWS